MTLLIMPIITPTILEPNILDFDEKLLKAQSLCSRVQIDVLDGQFVDNKTVMPEEWPHFSDDFLVDVHLMVLEPENWIGRLKEKNVDLIIGQYEDIGDLDTFIKNVNSVGKKVGVAIDIDTPITVVSEDLVLKFDSYILMAIKTGYAGQEFDPSVLPKIKALRDIIGNTAEIIVDGGIDEESGKLCADAGADVLAVNSYLWQDLEENYRKLVSL